MPEITINVKCSNDQKYSVTIDTSKTVLEFKQAIAEKCDTTADRQRLIYSGRVLKDNDTLETYKIAEGHTVHMVKGSAPSAGNTQTPQQPTGYSPNPFMMGGFNQGANPYGSPFGTTGTGGLQGVNPLDFLQNPAIMQYMQQMLQDPQFVESMIQMNPQFAQMAPQIRQMMQDPEFQAMMSNPETLRSLAALQPLMGNLGPFTGGAIPGFPGYNMPATTGTNPTTTTPQVPPEERFQSQLQQLNDMGFVDAQKNIRALQICQGN
ncbi:18971_t:CDS:2, partial [Racocetra fulgida]